MTYFTIFNLFTFFTAAILVFINGFFFVKKHKLLKKYGFPLFVPMNKLSKHDRAKYKFYNRLNLGMVICLFLLYALLGILFFK
ncbi:hypothetical protein BW716_29945 [[Flexibacter] sp. ATCC 35208]|nr:hypothetical protein BW716_29945 [[Flexibacter] sp. ATCC 35208]